MYFWLKIIFFLLYSCIKISAKTFGIETKKKFKLVDVEFELRKKLNQKMMHDDDAFEIAFISFFGQWQKRFIHSKEN